MNNVELKKQETMFLTWKQVETICAGYISRVIEREIKVWPSSDEPHLRNWGLYLGTESALTKSEGKELFDAVQADDYDRDANDFGEYPIRELSSGVGLKMLDQSLGLSTEMSYPDDEGIWLFQNAASVINLEIVYPD